MRDFLKEGSHSWERVYEYHNCPECGWVFESREARKIKGSASYKELSCPHCQHKYEEKREEKQAFGPLFGN